MALDELGELQKEWRAIVLDKLTSVEQFQKELKADIVDIKTTFVRQQALEALRENNRAAIDTLEIRVAQLTSFKNRLIGVVIGASTAVNFAFWLIQHFLTK